MSGRGREVLDHDLRPLVKKEKGKIEMEKIQLKYVDVKLLNHAPWNPRSEEELSPEDPSMADLIASIKNGGINQSLSVMETEDGSMIVIAGNRRLAAARAVGLVRVPAIVRSGISISRAQEITREENEIRKGINPIRDAQLIDDMITGGLSQKEIAAHFCMSEAGVCRRRKLINLVDEVREIAGPGGRITTDALEQIALYPAETQKDLADTIKRHVVRSKGSRVCWSELKYEFDLKTKNLDEAKFDTSACVKCPLRTGAQPDLWSEMPKDGSLGSCLDCKCYNDKFREMIKSRVQDQVGAGVELVDGEKDADVDRYEAENNNKLFSKRKSKKCPVAWWFYDRWCDKIEIVWGPKLAEYTAWLATVEAERAAEAERERNLSEEEKAEREEAEAERNRIIEERRIICDRVESARKVIEDKVNVDEDSFSKTFRKRVIEPAFKGRKADLIAKSVSEWLFECECDFAEFVLEFPEIVSAYKITEKEVAEFHAARKMMEKFDKAHKQ